MRGFVGRQPAAAMPLACPLFDGAGALPQPLCLAQESGSRLPFVALSKSGVILVERDQGAASIKTFDSGAFGPEVGIKRPNSPHFHRDISHLVPTAVFATHNRLTGWIRSFARALSAS